MNRPICLVFGSGGARGLSFIGALRAIQESNLPIQHIIGSSMGALIGAAYSSGTPLDKMGEFAKSFTFRKILRPDLWGPGIFNSSKLRIFAMELIRARSFEELSIQLTVMCTDLQTGSSLSFSHGPLIPPVVGSCLAAGAFTPVLHEGHYLVDGGYTDPVPISAAPEGSIIIAIDPSARPDWFIDLDRKRSWANLIKAKKLSQQLRKSSDILIYALGRERLRGSDCYMIIPQLGEMTFLEYNRAEWAIECGYQATTTILPEIHRRLSEKFE